MPCQKLSQSAHVFWITGLSAAGKTSFANVLAARLKQMADVPIVQLDGDELRKGLCADLGLSEEDRKENIRRAGEVAGLMYKAGMIVICAFISPYRAGRDCIRQSLPNGAFTEIFLSTPLSVCIERDPKGLYRLAEIGEIHGVTGLDAPYEQPLHPELVFDTSKASLEQMVNETVSHYFARSSVIDA